MTYRVATIKRISPLLPIRRYPAAQTVMRPRPPRMIDDLPDAIRRMIRVMGEANARTVWRMQQQGIQGSAPELLVYDWLDGRKVPFTFQSSYFGGRETEGGQVADFVLYILGDGVMIWRVQGEYWHSSMEAQTRDATKKMRLLHSYQDGQPVRFVIDLWENDIYKDRNGVCEDALGGDGRRDDAVQ